MVQLLAIAQDKCKLPILVLIHTTVSIGKVRGEANTYGLLNSVLNLPKGYHSDFFLGGGVGGDRWILAISLCIEKSI